jgi:uncharacterized membrane protein YqjE
VSDSPSGGLRGALAQLGLSSLALLRTRLALASLEFDEERELRINDLILVGIAAVAFAFALFAASTLIVVLFWETHRLGVLAVVALVYLLIGLGALWRIDVRRRTRAPPFAATLAEFERDRQWLGAQMDDGAKK